MTSKKLIKLEWDSEFFKFNVAKCTFELKTYADLRQLEELTLNDDTKLCYYFSNNEIPLITNSSYLNFVLVDKKFTFSKKIESIPKNDSLIRSLNKNDNLSKLQELAIQSGKFSRFKKDKRIPIEKFEDLYITWLANSINKEIATDVLVYIIDNSIGGFVTLGEKNERGDVGLIAVDKYYRGKGIGKSLMRSAEKLTSELGYSYIQVVTQQDNIAACKLYESCGYKLEKTEYIYHIWSNKNRNDSTI